MIKKYSTRYWNVAGCTADELIQEMEQWRTSRKSHLVCFCDANGLAHGWIELELQRAYRLADAVMADGIATKTLVKISGGELPERVFGPSLFIKAMEYGSKKGWRHFFYGAGPGVAEDLANKMRERFPNVNIVGTFSPPFHQLTEEEWKDIKEMITTSVPDFLWVSLGSPKQEKWCAKHLREFSSMTLLPVGAVFDFYTGRTPLTPDWVHKIGCCWLWRLLTGGKRIVKRNFWCVPRALGILLSEFFRCRIFKQKI